jgi:hypothetical protein
MGCDRHLLPCSCELLDPGVIYGLLIPSIAVPGMGNTSMGYDTCHHHRGFRLLWFSGCRRRNREYVFFAHIEPVDATNNFILDPFNYDLNDLVSAPSKPR